MKSFILRVFPIIFTLHLFGADIAVITITKGIDYQKRVKLGTDSKRTYCKKHGYDFICCEGSLDCSRQIFWSKILLALQTMETPSYRWIVWLDADTLIMNQDIRLEDIINEKANLIIGKDWNGINSGVFFIRNCDWSKRFLKSVYARTDCIDLKWPEQIAMYNEIQENLEFGAKVKIVPQRLFNSYPVELVSSENHTYQPGDFIIHFTGIHNNALSKLFDKYSQQIQEKRD